MLIATGVLMNVPADLYESSKIDGAGPVKQFTKIKLISKKILVMI